MKILHQEKLLPSPGLLLIALIFGVTLGVIVTVLSEPIGLVLGIILGVALPLLLIITSPRVVVTEQFLQAGRAKIPHADLGFAYSLEASAMQKTLGAEYQPQNFYLIRGWIKTGFEVEVKDPTDPTNKWVISSRNPELMVSALKRASKIAAKL